MMISSRNELNLLSFGPFQIRDTVELWRLPHQRKISLRFLASYLLNKDIQVRNS
jgi:hypothetical protein